MGRRSIHRQPMTATERQRRWRAKKRRASIWLGNQDPSARRPTPKRADKDFWPTPPELQVALIRHVLPLLPDGPVWECAAGDGVLADALIEAGREVIQSDVESAAPRDPQMRFPHGGSAAGNARIDPDHESALQRQRCVL
jgi:hypothetical protein